MSRSRNIKPGFFKNDLLAECQPLARLLFAGLWCEADRSGRLLDRPKKIKVDCLPYDECDCDQLLEELRSAGFIARYRISDIGYIQVLSFDKHQNPHKNEAISELPAMPTEVEQYKHSTSTVQEPKMDESIGLIPDSLNLIPDTSKKQAPVPGNAPVGAQPADPLWGTGLAFLIRKGLDNAAARRFLGKLKKEIGDIKAGAILVQAEAEDVSDPVPWLMAASQRASKPPPTKTRPLL